MLTGHTAIQVSKAIFQRGGMHLSFVTMSTSPVVMTKSSTTNLSIASGLRAFQTAVPNSSALLTEFIFNFTRIHVAQPTTSQTALDLPEELEVRLLLAVRTIPIPMGC